METRQAVTLNASLNKVFCYFLLIVSVIATDATSSKPPALEKRSNTQFDNFAHNEGSKTRTSTMTHVENNQELEDSIINGGNNKDEGLDTARSNDLPSLPNMFKNERNIDLDLDSRYSHGLPLLMSAEHDEDGDVSNIIVLEIQGSPFHVDDKALQIARDFGLVYHGKMGSLDNLYLFKRIPFVVKESRQREKRGFNDEFENSRFRHVVSDDKQHRVYRHVDPAQAVETLPNDLRMRTSHDSPDNNNKQSKTNTQNTISSFSPIHLNGKRSKIPFSDGDNGETQYSSKKRSIQSAKDLAKQLKHSHPSIKTVKHQIVLKRSRRDGEGLLSFNDLLYRDQWNIHGNIQGGEIYLFLS